MPEEEISGYLKYIRRNCEHKTAKNIDYDPIKQILFMKCLNCGEIIRKNNVPIELIQSTDPKLKKNNTVISINA